MMMSMNPKCKKTLLKIIVENKHMLFVIDEKYPQSDASTSIIAYLFEKDNFEVCWKGNFSAKFCLCASENESIAKKLESFFGSIELDNPNDKSKKEIKKDEICPLMFQIGDEEEFEFHGCVYGSDERIEEEVAAPVKDNKKNLLLMDGLFKLPMMKFYLNFEDKCYFMNLALKHFETQNAKVGAAGPDKPKEDDKTMVSLKQMKLLKKITNDFSKTQYVSVCVDTSKPKRVYTASFELFCKKWDFKLYTEDDNYDYKPGVYLFLQDRSTQVYDMKIKFKISTADGKFSRYCEHMFDSEFMRKGKGWGGDLSFNEGANGPKHEFTIAKPVEVFNIELIIDAIELTSAGEM